MTEDPTNPRHALEASLTALLLGELPPDQAAFLREAIARDPELARRHERLKSAIELVRFTSNSPDAQPTAQTAPLKLSEARRQALLLRFKTVAPKEFSKHQTQTKPWLLFAAALVLLMGLVAAV